MIYKKLWKHTLLVMCVLSIHLSFSQENFETAYLLNNEGDTIKGYVDYRNWLENPEVIKFKEHLDHEPKIITPLEIKGFGVADEIYLSAITDIETSSILTSELDFHSDLNLKKDTIFLQTLFMGDKSLFYYRSQAAKDNFYIMIDGQFELLIYKKYIVSNETGERFTKENQKYKGQLSVYMNDPLLSTDIGRTKYKRKYLEKIYNKYYKNAAASPDFRKKHDKTIFEFGVLAGASVTNFNFNSNDGYKEEIVNADYETSVDFTAAVYMDIVLPRNLNKWSVNNEISYSSYKVTGSYSNFVNENNYENYQIEFAYSYIKMNNMLRYKYPVGNNIALFVNLGISNGFVISEKNQVKGESVIYSVKRTEEYEGIPNSRKYVQGWIGGFGSRYKNLSLEVRYESTNGMSPTPGFKTTVNKWFLLLGYRF